MFEVRLQNRRGMRTGIRAPVAFLACAFFLGFHAPAQAAAGTVTNTNDSGAGSLRMAIEEATGGEAIEFEGLNGQTITLTTGAIVIDKSLEIIGPGASQLAVDGGEASRIFTITEGDVSISGLNLSDGASPEGDGGAIEATGPGSLTISNSTFEGNAAGGEGGIGDSTGQGDGGAIAYKGTASLTISGSTFTANTAGGAGGLGQGSGAGDGGAIRIAASAVSASVSNSVFTGNSAGGAGNAAFNSGLGTGGAIKDVSGGPLTVSDSTFSGNAAGGDGGAGDNSGVGRGGAIDQAAGGSLTVTDSAFTSNVAGGQGSGGSSSGQGAGGAIDVGSATVIVGSTLAANAVGGDSGIGSFSGRGTGGAIYASGPTLSVSNSTLFGNAAGGSADGTGGAIVLANASNSATLKSVTIDANTVGGAGEGAGIAEIKPPLEDSEITAEATIVSGNTGAPNCNLPVASSSYSLEGPDAGNTSCGFDLPSANPELEALADNGGPTQTQALPESSPAVDAVPAAACPTSVDQRGEPRPDNGKAFCDVGAFELQDPPVAPTITSGGAATFQVGEAGSFTVEATGLPTPSLSREGALPNGVGFTDNADGTANLSGTPAAGTEGNYAIAIEASNGVSPDATQSFTLKVTAPDAPDDPAEPPGGPGNPQEPPLPVLDLSLGVERMSLPQLRRSGRLIVAAKVNRAATVAFSGWAKLGGRARSSARGRFVRVLQRKTVRFGQAGQRRVALALTRRGRRVLRRMPRMRLVIVGRAIDSAGASTRSRAAVLLTSRPRLVVLYHQEGGFGNPRPSLLVLGNRWTRVSLGRCGEKFRLSRPAWRRLRVALRSVDIGAIAGDYPAPSGAADLITYVVKTRAGTVRVTPASRPDDEEVMRALRPLLNVLDRTVAAGERRMPPSCKSNR